MPTFILKTNISSIDSHLELEIHNQIRSIISDSIGKSKEFVLTIVHQGVSMQFGETNNPCAYCELKNVGLLQPKITSQLSGLICSMIMEKINIASQQIYIEFQESERHLWGWNGKTFA